IIDRTIRTFDQVRDPDTFLIDLDEAFRNVEQQQPQPEMGALLQMLGGGAQGEPALNGAEGGF
ncbi:MAG: hypothetical protein V3V92_06645, partial [Candidatus Hydrothermarchaeales archaeon]